MNKNIFQVLADSDDSDNETQKPKVKKPTKKQQRHKDNLLRQHHGDHVQKDQKSLNRPNKNPRPKDDYGKGEKRPFERHSGTGKPAFKKNNNKKGGYGKGNVGAYENEKNYKDDGVNTIEQKIDSNLDNLEGGENVVKEEPEEIVLLDEYVGNTGAKFGIKRKQSDVKNKDPRVFEDDNTTALVSKKSLRDNNYPKKKYSGNDGKSFGKNIIQVDVGAGGKKKQDRRGGKKKKIRYDKEEFPELG